MPLTLHIETNVLVYNNIVSVFELQLGNYILFRASTIRKGAKPHFPPSYVLNSPTISISKNGFGINNPWKLMWHYTHTHTKKNTKKIQKKKQKTKKKQLSILLIELRLLLFRMIKNLSNYRMQKQLIFLFTLLNYLVCVWLFTIWKLALDRFLFQYLTIDCYFFCKPLPFNWTNNY